MKYGILLALPAFFVLISFALACDYSVNGDTECNPSAGLYCVDHTCQTVADATIWCHDSDANSLTTLGDVNARYRDYAGRFMANDNADTCLNGSTIASSCSGPACKLWEYTCTPSYGFPYSYQEYPCSLCQNGACIGPDYMPQGREGTACDFHTQGDANCDTANGYYCTSGQCTHVTDPSLSCTDTDQQVLAQISLWSSGQINNMQILQIIEKWVQCSGGRSDLFNHPVIN